WSDVEKKSSLTAIVGRGFSLREAGSRIAKTGLRAVPAALFAAFLVSCSSTTSDLNTAGFAGEMTATDVEAGGVGAGAALSASVEADGEQALEAATVPGGKPGAKAPPVAEGGAQPAAEGAAPLVAEAPAQPKQFLSAAPAPDNGTYLTAGQMPADAPIAA